MAGMNDIAKEACLNPIEIPEDVRGDARVRKLPTTDQLEAFFALIIKHCVAGEVVRIKNFGTFSMRTMKGRTLRSPLMPGGEITFPDKRVLRFHQSQVVKTRINTKLQSEGDKKAIKKPKKSKKVKKTKQSKKPKPKKAEAEGKGG